MSRRPAEALWVRANRRAGPVRREALRKWLPRPSAYAPTAERRAERYGYEWAFRLRDYLQWHHYFELGDAVLDTLVAVARPGDVVVDVGANVGLYGVLAARAVGPAGRVLCFEPNPETAAHLRRHVQMNGVGNVTVVEKGVGAGPATLRLAASGWGDSGKFSLLPPKTAPAVTYDVAVVALDAELAEREVDHVDVVKVDVEGFEMEVMAGAWGTIERDRPVLVLELAPGRYGAEAARATERLVGLGYRFAYISDYPDVHATPLDPADFLSRTTGTYDVIATVDPRVLDRVGEVHRSQGGRVRPPS